MTLIKPVRRALAKALHVPESTNVRREGLYAFHYGSYVMVRVYTWKDAVPNDYGKVLPVKVFEEKVPAHQFNLDNHELIAKLMLVC